MNEFIISNRFDFVAITETWLTSDDVIDNQIFSESCPPDFLFFSIPRHSRRGGGIALIYHKRLAVQLISNFHLSTAFESACFRINTISDSFMLVVIYRPPDLTRSIFEHDFTSLVGKLLPCPKFIICGDFNLSKISPRAEAQSSEDLFLASLDLCQHVLEPTRGDNILDLILTRSSSTDLLLSTLVVDGMSDHNAVNFTMRIRVPTLAISPPIYRRAYHRILHDAFANDIHTFVSIPIFSFLMSVMQQPDDVSPHSNSCDYDFDSVFTHYDSTIRAIVNQHAPLRIIKNRRCTVSWWSPLLANLRKTMRQKERLWRKSKLEIHLLCFRESKAAFHTSIKVAKSNSLKRDIEKFSDSPKQLWRILNAAAGRAPVHKLPSHESPLNLAQQFNKFFIDKVDRIHAAMQLSVPPANSSSVSATDILSTFRLFSESELKRIIAKSPTKSDVMDPLPTWLLKQHLPVFLPLLTALVNFSLSCEMPRAYKHALVRPLLKKRNMDTNELNSFRPVCGLPFISKLIERCVADRVVSHLDAVAGFDSYQSGYRSNHSCESAVTYVLDNVFSAADDRQITVLTLLDLSSAFDTVNHDILLTKLSLVGVKDSALQWISLYLSSRSQSVIIGSTTSPSLPLRTGVPQGSVLGPLLFTVYLFGIAEIFEKYSIKYVIYADDIQLIVTARVCELCSALQNLANCIGEVKTWLLSHKLLLNESKTEIILLGSRQLLSKCALPSFSLGGAEISFSPCVRDLGVFIDKFLTFDRHISKVSSVAFSHLHVIGRIRRSLSSVQAHMLVQSLVISRINYCSTIYNGLTNKQLQRLQRIQNAAMRIVTRRKKSQSVKEDMEKYNWLGISDLVPYRTASFIFSIQTSGKPVYLRSLLRDYVPKRYLRSGDQSLLEIPRTETTIGSRAFRSYGPKLWNSLSSFVKNSPSLSQFKSRLRESMG
jgi:hypothetical protein